LGLDEAVVTREKFAAFVQCDMKGLGADSKRQRVSEIKYIEFTYSPPKAVSVVAAVDDRVKVELYAAVKEELLWFEQQVEVRDRRGNLANEEVTKPTGKMIAALFQHETSRTNDPDFHVHTLIGNVTWDDERKGYFAVHYGRMLELRKTLDARIHNNLAARMGGLGYHVETAPSGFGLKEVPTSAMAMFSERSRQVETVMALLKRGYKSQQISSAFKGVNEDEKRKWLTQGVEPLRERMGAPQAPPRVVTACDRALALEPNHAIVWHNTGVALNNLGRNEEALTACNRALALKPDYASAWIDKGVALSNLGRKEEALTAYDRVLALKTHYERAWTNKGVALSDLGRNEEALTAYDRALNLKPDHAGAWQNKGDALSALGRNEEALAAYDRTLTLKPDDPMAWGSKGNSLRTLGREEEALTAYDHVLNLNPDHAGTWNNKGNALKALGRKEQALIAYDRALALKPDFYGAWYNKGCALFELGRYEEALTAFDEALALDPNNHKLMGLRNNLATLV